MTTPYRILYEARQDVLEAEARLEREHPGYGTVFTDEFVAAVRSVLDQPRMYPQTEDGPRNVETREYFIQRFEYRVIYAIDREEVVFLAVYHARSRPGAWRRRLAQ
jgi:plasmid stabilization system protein ParE